MSTTDSDPQVRTSRSWNNAPVPRGIAALVALAIGGTLGWRTYVYELAIGNAGGDFRVYRNAALRLLDGLNPYELDTLLYPLPSILVIVPLARLQAEVGVGVFMGLGVLALSYGLLRHHGWLGLVMLLSPAFFLGWFYLQWSPLIVAGAFLPWIAGFGAAKPNVAFAPFAYRPAWQGIAGGLLLAGISWLIVPTWLGDWLGDVGQQTAPHTSPLRWPFGVLTLVALLRWRRPEARALLILAASPLNPQYYDHLGAWLAAASWKDSIVLSVCGWVGFLAFLATTPHDLTRDATPAYLSVTLGVYVPAALLLLRHPNVGRLPQRLERLAAGLPRWIRGRPSLQD